jgi:hypothetical protein
MSSVWQQVTIKEVINVREWEQNPRILTMTRGALEDPLDDRFSFSKAARFWSRICNQAKHFNQ